jgi:endonuclease YncB( thermonuclease family)
MRTQGGGQQFCYPDGMKCIALLLALALSFLVTAASAEPIQPGAIGIVDGDTITMRGLDRQVRLLGFDTPETGWEAKCAAERTLAAKATERLRQIVAGGGLDLEIVPCKCWQQSGKFGCNAGRYCGFLRAKGRDVAALMIGEGLARPGRRKWLPQHYSWCD